MAYGFTRSKKATLKGRATTGMDDYTIANVSSSDTITPAIAATQANKLLAVFGKEIAGDDHMSRTIKENVEEDE